MAISSICVDIETFNLSADFGIILCGVIKEEGKKPIVFRHDKLCKTWDKKRSDDSEVVRAIAAEMCKHPIWVAHNGRRFDLPYINTRLLRKGMPPLPQPKAMIDPVELARNKLRMSFNGLGQIAQILGVNTKTDVDAEVWCAAAFDGCRSSMNKIVAHCLAPHHRVLTADLRWVPLGSLCVGDRLVGFEEENISGWGRRYQEAIVEQIYPDKAELYEVVLSDNTIINATADHLWLCGSAEKRGWKWARTDRMWTAERHGQYSTKLYRMFDLWDAAKTWDAGYLAGILDGEGHINPRAVFAFGQRPGVVLDEAKKCLESFGNCTARLVENKEKSGGFAGSKGDTHSVYICGSLPDRVRILGMVRPYRLLQKIDINSWGRMERRIGDGYLADVGHGACEVVSVRPCGMGDIVRIKTSTATFFAEGLPMHNCIEDVVTLERVVDKLKELSSGFNAYGSGR